MRRVNIAHGHVRALLSDPSVPILTIETYVALSLARQIVWRAESGGDIAPDELLFPVDFAAEMLGLESDELYRAILADEVQAALLINRHEVERLAAQQRRHAR